MSIAVLAAVTIFPPSSRWTYWVINMRSTSTDDVIRLASLRHQLCVLDVCQNRVLPSPYSRLPSVLKPTGPGIACQTCGESQKPSLVRVQVKRKSMALKWTPPHTWYRSKAKKCSLTRPASLGIQGGGGLQKVVGRIEFLGLKVVPHMLLTPRCASWITIQCWIGIKMKWGGWKEKGWLEWKVRFSFWALGTPL